MNIKIEKVKVGLWRPTSWFDAYVDGVCIGRYKTKKEATAKAEARAKAREEYLRQLDEELDWEFFANG